MSSLNTDASKNVSYMSSLNADASKSLLSMLSSTEGVFQVCHFYYIFMDAQQFKKMVYIHASLQM